MNDSHFIAVICRAKARGFLLRAVFVFVLACAAAFAAAPSSVFALEITEDIAVDTIGSNTDEPYVLSDGQNVNVAFGAALTIEPGVIVKFGDMAFLNIDGALRAVGVAAAPIIFTSLLNDSVGGDTNGDGSATEPSALDEWGINFGKNYGSYGWRFDTEEVSGPHALSHVIVSYSSDGLWFSRTQASLQDISVIHSGSAVGGVMSVLSLNGAHLSDIGEGIIGYEGSRFDIAYANIENVTDGDALAF